MATMSQIASATIRNATERTRKLYENSADKTPLSPDESRLFAYLDESAKGLAVPSARTEETLVWYGNAMCAIGLLQGMGITKKRFTVEEARREMHEMYGEFTEAAYHG